MDTGAILQVFTVVTSAFSPIITIVLAVVAAGVGIRWVISALKK